MINKLRTILVVLSFLLAGLVFTPSVGAVTIDLCKDAPSGSAVCAKKDDNLTLMWRTVINTLVLLVGLIAVIMIIIGGMRYALSGGEQKSITEAKNIILYSVIGLVVAFSAYAILNWVVAQF